MTTNTSTLFPDYPELQHALDKVYGWAVSNAPTSVYAEAALTYVESIPEVRILAKRTFYTQPQADADQLRYILTNLRYWRGYDAQVCKQVLAEAIVRLGS